LELAYEASTAGSSKLITLQLDNQKKAVSALITQLAVYVQQVSVGDAATIFSSGMGVRAGKSPSQPLPAPGSLTATMGDKEGTVKLKWPPVPGAKSYLIQMSPDGSTGWVIFGSSTKSNIVVTGLVPNSKMWFRVAAVGPKGQGPWCEPVKGIAG
jgi:hypothetical protein